MIEIFYQTLAS